MKRLILMRHAKSSWADPGQEDIDRPLNTRGIRDAARIGRWLLDLRYQPDQALISTAERTRQTWAGVAGVIDPPRAEFLADLYHASAETLLTALRGATGDTVLILAHQPGIGDFAHRLVTDRPVNPGFDEYPTAATAILDFDTPDWAGITLGSARLTDFTIPRALD